MKYFDNYHLPTTIDEALDLLAHYGGHARVIAGGTDLLVDLQSHYFEGQRPRYAALVDVTEIAGANEIRADGEWVVIGCGVTHTQIVESQLIQTRATALAEACAVVGGPQVRNVATLIGNVAHALPAADGTIALVALEAEVRIASRVGANNCAGRQEWHPLASVFRGPGESAVDTTREMIVEVRFRQTGKDDSSSFARIMRPQGVALPILAMAIRVKGSQISSQRDSVLSDFRLKVPLGFQIEDVAISAGPVAPVPFRARKTEEFLRGKAHSKETVDRAGEILLSEAGPRTSPHRATKEYRVEILPTLLEQTLQAAVDRARGLTAMTTRG
jgi:CO/xanthine dehydrogenase FAD-binding subunit